MLGTRSSSVPAILLAASTAALFACSPQGGDAAESGEPGSSAQGSAGGSGEAAAAASLVVSEGTVLTVRLDQTVSTSESSEGDAFSATVTEAVTVDGETAIPSGATVRGVVGKAGTVETEQGEQKNVIALTPETIELHGQPHEIQAEITSMEVQERDERLTGGDAAIIGGSTAGGAILGAILGDETGAVVGGMAGMATSTAIVVANKGTELRVSEGTTMRMALRESLRVR